MTPPDAAHALSLPGTAFDGPRLRRIQRRRLTAGSAPVLCECAAGQIASEVGIRSGSNRIRFRLDLKLDGKDEGLLLSLVSCLLSLVSRCDGRRAVGWGCSGSCQMLTSDAAGSMLLARCCWLRMAHACPCRSVYAILALCMPAPTSDCLSAHARLAAQLREQNRRLRNARNEVDGKWGSADYREAEYAKR